MTLNQNGYSFKDWLLIKKFLQSIESGSKFIFNKDNAIQVRVDETFGKGSQLWIVPVVFVEIIFFKNRKLYLLRIGHQLIQDF